MPLTFEVLDAESGRFIYPDDIYDDLLTEFDGLLDGHETGQLADKPYLAALDRLLTEAPDFVDVYAHIASHWHRQGKPKKALDAALLGLSVSNRLIPEGFAGRIEWVHLDNRPYLRAMHVALLSYMRLRRHKCQWEPNNPHLWELNFPHPFLKERKNGRVGSGRK